MIYRFGEFQLDAARETLTGSDGDIPLRGHALLVLKLLVERSPEVVSRDEILSSVWGHDALSESSIAQVIKDIRQALGDSARSPQHVVTKYGRGYQFVARVEILDAQSVGDAGTVARGPKHVWARFTGALLLLLAALLLWYWFAPTGQTPGEGVADGPRWLIRGVEANEGESLSDPFARYLSLVLGSAVGSERVGLANDDEEIPGVRYLDVSLAVHEDRPMERFTLQLGAQDDQDVALRRAYSEVDQLVGASLERLFEELSDSPKAEVELGLVSQSPYATETLLRGMAAQYAGETERAVALFEACLAEDPSFDFARYELAIALRRQGDYERALGSLQAVESRRSSDFWQRRTQNAKGILLWRLGRLDEAAEAYERASQAMAEDSITRAVIDVNLGLLYRDLGRYEEAEQAALASIEETRRPVYRSIQPSAHRIRASALNTLASVYMETGRLEEAIAPLEMARELFYEGGQRGSYAAVLSRTSKVRERLGETNAAIQLLNLAVSVREQLGNELDVAGSRIDLSRLSRIQGDFDEARAQARRAVEIGTQTGDPQILSDGNACLAELALAAGRYADAAAYAAEALRWAELRGETDALLEARQRSLRVEMAAGGSTEEVTAQVSALLDQAESLEMTSLAIDLRLLRGRVAARGGDHASARSEFESVVQLAEHAAERSLQRSAMIELARLDLDSAPMRAREWLTRAERLNPPAHPFLILKARVLDANGQGQEALALAYQARETSGDWWSPEDQRFLDALEAAQVSG